MDPPPTYEESLEEQKSNNDDESIIPSVPSDAQILFTIAGLVQIFYIKIDGTVSAPSYPSSLFIFRFCDSKEDSAFLQVGTWVYPLIKGKSPILKSNEGAYMFPDLDESIEGNAIGNVQLYFVLWQFFTLDGVANLDLNIYHRKVTLTSLWQMLRPTWTI